MSFWPFSNTYNNNSHLQRFLDTVSDFSSVSVDQLLEDKAIQQEFLDELKTIASKSARNKNLSFAPSLQADSQHKSFGQSNSSDNSSITSSTTESNSGGNTLSKTAREQKLLELLLQPHILEGFINYIYLSVDFFHELSLQENEEVTEDATENLSSSNLSTGKKIDSEETRNEKLQRCISSSAEVLSTDLWVISNRIIETPSLMSRLWSVMSLPNLHESSTSLAYFIQILDHLMETNCIELTNFVRKQPTLVDTFLAKIEIPILMDFFLKIIQTDKAESPTGIIDVLVRQKMIPKLIDILKPDPSCLDWNEMSDPTHFFRQTSTTEFIKALVTISSNPSLAVDLDNNIGPNPLTRELASRKIITSMLNDIILYRPSDSENSDQPLYSNKYGISNCVSILIELIRKNNSDYDLNCGTYSNQPQANDGTNEVNVHSMMLWLKDLDQNPPGPRDPIYLGDLLEIFSNNLDKLTELTTVESKLEPFTGKALGITKFRVSELVAELLHCSNMILLNSKGVASLIKARDIIRERQDSSISDALNDSIYTDGLEFPQSGTQPIFKITDAVDEMSLNNESRDESMTSEREESSNESEIEAGFDRNQKVDVAQKSRDFLQLFSDLEADEEEPFVSTEHPFVCEERNKDFRNDPCVGDLFKIKLKDSHMLQRIVEQFTDYSWNNFFHNVVFDLVQQVFNGKLNSYNSFLIVELFEQCKITEIIVNAFKSNIEPRPGYIGHLVLISEEVVKFTSLYKPALISPIIVEYVGSKTWEWFVSEVLLKTRELYNVILGTDPDYSESGNGDDEDDRKYGFDSSTVGQMDMENTHDAIILGDSNNHDEFVAENSNFDDDLDEIDEEDGLEYSKASNKKNRGRILDVPIKNMSPSAELDDTDMFCEDISSDKLSIGQGKMDYFDDFPGSSSSDEETENQLYRVSKHQD